MNHLDFILWMLLFPSSVSLTSYIDALKKQITKEHQKEFSKDTEVWAGMIIILFWLFIGYELF